MSGQSWKQTVEELSGPEPALTKAYVFSGGQSDNNRTAVGDPKKKKPDGTFYEREKHGAFNE